MNLTDCLGAEFRCDRFDATDVFSRAFRNPQLMAALEQEIPNLYHKRDGTMNTRAIRTAIKRLPGIEKRHNLEADYWSFQVASELS
jgi:hypothetical protein